MTRFEIQIRDRFEYVVAKDEASALVEVRKSMTATERHWSTPIFTGRDIAGY